MGILNRVIVGVAVGALSLGNTVVAQGQDGETEFNRPVEIHDESFIEGGSSPIVDGVGGYSEQELNEFHDVVRAGENQGAPSDHVAEGEMWSDEVGVPDGVDISEADQSEVLIAQQSQSVNLRAVGQRCRTFWPSTIPVCGATLTQYERLGAQLSWLLDPVEVKKANPGGTGFRQKFRNGWIYWSAEHGAHAVATHTATVWARHGWEAGWLGYPTSGEVPVSGSNPIDGELNGWVQRFEGGNIYRSPALQGFHVASINGVILDTWISQGGPGSKLGFPVVDEKPTSSAGRVSVFQRGSMYWWPTKGAFELPRGILDVWKENGAETGTYGYPVAAPVRDEAFKVTQKFERGEIESFDYPISEFAQMAGLSQEEFAETYDLLLNDFLDRGIDPVQGFIDSFEHLKESYDFHNNEPAELGNASFRAVPGTACGNAPGQTPLTKPGNANTRIGDVFYSTAVRARVVNHGHNGIFVSTGPNEADRVTIEAVGGERGVEKLGADRVGVCKPQLLRVKASEAERLAAARWAETKEGTGYNSNFATTRIGSLNRDSYNCSQLVWAAYKAASNGQIDIGERFPYEPYRAGVYPIDILRSHRTVEYS